MWKLLVVIVRLPLFLLLLALNVFLIGGMKVLFALWALFWFPLNIPFWWLGALFRNDRNHVRHQIDHYWYQDRYEWRNYLNDLRKLWLWGTGKSDE
jgi:hypothetical protein